MVQIRYLVSVFIVAGSLLRCAPDNSAVTKDPESNTPLDREIKLSVPELVGVLKGATTPDLDFYQVRTKLRAAPGEYQAQLQSLTHQEIANLTNNLNILYERSDSKLNRNLNYYGSFLRLTSAQPLADLTGPIAVELKRRNVAAFVVAQIRTLLPRFNNDLGLQLTHDLTTLFEYQDPIATDAYWQFLKNGRETPLNAENFSEKHRQFFEFNLPLVDKIEMMPEVLKPNGLLAFGALQIIVPNLILGIQNTQFVDDFIVIATPHRIDANNRRIFWPEVPPLEVDKANRDILSIRRFEDMRAALTPRTDAIIARLRGLGISPEDIQNIRFSVARPTPDTTISFVHALRDLYPLQSGPKLMKVRLVYGIDIGAANPQVAITTLDLRCLGNISFSQANSLIVLWQQMKQLGEAFLESKAETDGKRLAKFGSAFSESPLRELSQDSCRSLPKIFLDACEDIDLNTLRMGNEGRFAS